MYKRILSILVSVCLLLNIALPMAAANEKNTLTLNDAVKMALERNRNLKIQELNIDKTEEELEDLEDTIKYIPDGVYIPGVSPAYAGFLSKRVEHRVAKKAYEAMRQQTVVDVKELYYEVLKAEQEVDLAQKAVDLAERHYRVAQVKHSLGMIPKAELLGYETNLTNERANLLSAKNTLKEAQTELAILIGYNGEFNYQLEDNVAFQKADFTSLDAVIAQALSQRYEIWAAERIADVADRTKEYLDNYNVGDINSDIKELEAGNAKDEMKKNIEKLYLSLQYMEEAYKTANQNLTTLEEKLRVIKVMNEVGMATDIQLREVEQEYNKAAKKLNDLIYQHDFVKSQLQVLAGDDLLTAVLKDNS